MAQLSDHLIRFIRLQFGLLVFAIAIVLMLEARIGLDPWSALHEGLSARTGLSFGTVTQLTGLALIALSWLFLRVVPRLGTISNMLCIGPWINTIRGLELIAVWPGDFTGIGQFLLGIAVMALATALYIGASYGAGPRDGFILGLAARFQSSIRATRIGIEVVVLSSAWLLGGSIGIGTVVFALLMGPAMQASLRLFRVDTRPNTAVVPVEPSLSAHSPSEA